MCMIRKVSGHQIGTVDKETSMKALGQTLAGYRKALHYKQADVSNQLKLRFGMDVSVHSISHWEKEVAVPNAKQFLALCEIYEISNINEAFMIYFGHDPISLLNFMPFSVI